MSPENKARLAGPAAPAGADIPTCMHVDARQKILDMPTEIPGNSWKFLKWIRNVGLRGVNSRGWHPREFWGRFRRPRRLLRRPGGFFGGADQLRTCARARRAGSTVCPVPEAGRAGGEGRGAGAPPPVFPLEKPPPRAPRGISGKSHGAPWGCRGAPWRRHGVPRAAPEISWKFLAATGSPLKRGKRRCSAPCGALGFSGNPGGAHGGARARRVGNTLCSVPEAGRAGGEGRGAGAPPPVFPLEKPPPRAPPGISRNFHGAPWGCRGAPWRRHGVPRAAPGISWKFLEIPGGHRIAKVAGQGDPGIATIPLVS